MSDILCKFCGQVYDTDQVGICPQCGIRSGNLVCQDCGAVFNPATAKDHKCPSCKTPAPDGWHDERYFLMKEARRENPGILFPGRDDQKGRNV